MFGFLRKLFTGGGQRDWYRSKSGNLTCVRNGLRLTVFEDATYGGWQYCIAADTPNSVPYFCETKFGTEEAAKEAAEKEVQSA